MSLLVLACPFVTVAQKCPHIRYDNTWYNPKTDRQLWLEAAAGGYDGWFTVNLGGYVYRSVTVETGISYAGMHIGPTYHLPVRSKHMDPYAGLVLSYNCGVDTYLFEQQPGKTMLFLPVGCRYVFSNGISAGAELDMHTGNDFPVVWGAVKLGYCFRTGH